jgi:hypothetical protein
MLIHASAKAMDFPKSFASFLHLPAILTANSYQKAHSSECASPRQSDLHMIVRHVRTPDPLLGL